MIKALHPAVAAGLALFLSFESATADPVRSDRGIDDLRSYDIKTAQTEESTSTPETTRNTTTLSDAAIKFGSPDRNFESGRR